MTKAEMYSSFLRSEGYAPNVDSDGDVRFKFEGGNYIIFAYEKDPQYFLLMFPGFWPIESPEELQRALVAANTVNRDTKVVKISLNPDLTDVSATVEAFLPTPESFQQVFSRAINVTKVGVKKFMDFMNSASE
jgi:hypothetical protein